MTSQQRQKMQQAEIALEEAIAQAIHEFEKKCPSRFVYSIQIYRETKKQFQIDATTLPRKSL